MATSDPGEELESRDEKAKVLGAIGRLPDQEWMATMLFYISAYSHQEIASFLGLSTTTVNNRLRSARKHLQKEMLKMAKRELQGQAPSRDERFAQRVAHLLQPEDMKTEHYQYGIEAVDGHQAWALFCASGAGDLARVSALLDRDPKLVNAQYWYQFPIHMAVREGHAEVVQLLLQAGADPGQSRYTYNSWDKLLAIAEERGYERGAGAAGGGDARALWLRSGFCRAGRGDQRPRPGAGRGGVGRASRLYPRRRCVGQWAAALGGADAAKRLGGFLCRTGVPILKPVAPMARRRYWSRSMATTGFGRAICRRKRREIRGFVTRHLLACGAEYALSIACAAGDGDRVDAVTGEPIRPKPARSMRDGAVRCPMLLVTAIPRLSKNCWTWVPIPISPKENAPRGKALFEACAGNHLETAKLLLERGADPNAGVDSSGSCLTIVEFRHGKKGQQMQALLREYGAVMPPYAMDDAALERAMREGGCRRCGFHNSCTS